MHIKINIRDVTENDIETWSEMRTSLWPDTRDNHQSEIRQYFSGQSIDITQTFVAEINGDVIGFIELNIRSFAEGSRSSEVPYVEAWYIKPEHQFKGYGKQLMLAAESWAISGGFNELASDTEIDNNLSIQVHKHLGFQETERVVCFLKTLSEAE